MNAIFDVDPIALANPSTRDQFKTRIGWIEAEGRKSHYDTWDVEIIHSNWTGKFNSKTVFTGESMK
jgi:hypothetical protein